MQRNRPPEHRRRSHYRVTLGDALQAHEEALKLGGRRGVLSLSLLQSAIGRPYSGHYRSIAKKASALVESLARNHAFVDGNKRTALLCTYLLIDRSGYMLNSAGCDLNSEFETLILRIANERPTFQEIESWFIQRL